MFVDLCSFDSRIFLESKQQVGHIDVFVKTDTNADFVFSIQNIFFLKELDTSYAGPALPAKLRLAEDA